MTWNPNSTFNPKGDTGDDEEDKRKKRGLQSYSFRRRNKRSAASDTIKAYFPSDHKASLPSDHHHKKDDQERRADDDERPKVTKDREVYKNGKEEIHENMKYTSRIVMENRNKAGINGFLKGSSRFLKQSLEKRMAGKEK